MAEFSFGNHFLNHWKLPNRLVEFGPQPIDGTWPQIKIEQLDRQKSERPDFFSIDGNRIFTSVIPNSTSNNGLVVRNLQGDPVAGIQIDASTRSVVVPFSLDEAIENLLTEKYLQHEKGDRLIGTARQMFYSIKPLIPRSIQINMRRRAAAGIMSKRAFPDWPLDTSVDDLNRLILQLVLGLLGDEQVPGIGLWPDGHEFCVVLTHDVEQMVGQKNVEKLAEIEKEQGIRSAWFFVPERYPVDYKLLGELKNEGFEIGVHGLYHDGKLFKSHAIFSERTPRINYYIEAWNSVGFRSPSAIRRLNWLSEQIKVSYDTSCPTSERYGAQPGGCCTIYPFEYQGMVELPITLPQDHTLLEILEYTPEQTLQIWLETIHEIKRRGGLALVIVHPDYLLTAERLEMYKRFLQTLRQEISAWFALPRDVAHWWRERQSSTLIFSPDKEWHIKGAAAERGKVIGLL